jgi:C4-dicarboxylate-specific signal transduction histidine kinase
VKVSRLPDHLPAVRVVRHKLLQVFINLILNALDASAKDGQLTLAAGSTDAETWLSVADQGSGISADLLGRIFEPFFTTKPPGKGRGLGLSVCQRVLEEAGGRLEVHSEVGQGSIFTVYLPTAELQQES